MKRWYLIVAITVTLFTVVHITFVQPQSGRTLREILNKVYDPTLKRLRTTSWAGPATAAQLTETEIFNFVFDSQNNMLKVTAGGHTIKDEGNTLVTETNLNFIGAGVSCIDNVGAASTDCTITGAAAGDAIADGVTKGIATYTAADFNSAAGVISLDYTNGQKATTSIPGFLSAVDWTTFNNKQASLGYSAEDTANKSTVTSLGTSNVLYPSQNAVKVYVDSGTKTLSNTRIKSRDCVKSDATPVDVNADNCDFVKVAELSQTTTFNAPTGTHNDGDFLAYAIFTTVARTLTFVTTANGFSAENAIALPTVSKTAEYVLYGFRWNSTSSKWSMVSATQSTTTGTSGQCYKSNGAGVEPSFQACGGGTTGFVHLPIGSPNLPVTNAATIDNSENNTRLLFDAATSECAIWPFRLPPDFLSGPVLKWQYSMTSATTGGVSIDVSVMAVTPGDAADINTDSYDTVNNCDDATVPGTAGFLDTISCTLTNFDSGAAGDYVKIKVCRAVADAADTATGDMEGIAAMLEYTK